MHRLVLVSLAATLCAFGGPNLVQNFSFENFNTPSVTTVSYTGTMSAPSVASFWNIWNNTNATTTTILCPDDPVCSRIPAPAPVDGLRMIYVDATAAFNGIWQAWDVPNSGSTNATTNAWLYIKSGSVMVGTGNDGSTVPELVLTTTGTWLNLQWFNTQANNKPANEIVFYSYNGPAQFFVDNVSVFDGIPEPATFGLAGAALIAFGAAVRKRSRKQ